MELMEKQGFKQTEVGLIPDDWNVKKLEEVLQFGSGQDYKHLSRGEIPVYGTGGLMTFVNNYLYNGDSVGIGRKGTIDKPVFLSGKFWTVDTLFYTHSFVNSFPKFIYYKFLMIPWKEFNEASGVPSLNKNTLGKINISIPQTLEEQKAIATALSDVDELITNLDKLITKKKAIKQGAMQQLLTPPHKGGKRLAGFSGEWKENYLKDLIWFQEGPGVRKHQFTTKGVKLLNGTNIHFGELDLDRTERYVSNHEAYGWYSHFLVDEGDVLIACSGITVSRFDEKVTEAEKKHLPLCMNTSTMRFKMKSQDINKDFFIHYLKSSYFKTQIGGQATGSAQLNFGPSHVEKVIMTIPSFQEQKGIAEILSSMDNELKYLSAKKDKYQSIKQGMMQELLTGKTRLI